MGKPGARSGGGGRASGGGKTSNFKLQRNFKQQNSKLKMKRIGLLIIGVLVALAGRAATVEGDLKDISIEALNTKLLFAPPNEVLVKPSGLSAGPRKVLESANGHFSVVLEAGDYTVTLPLIPWRHGFGISVMDTTGTVNI